LFSEVEVNARHDCVQFQINIRIRRAEERIKVKVAKRHIAVFELHADDVADQVLNPGANGPAQGAAIGIINLAATPIE
jgi:hypothetical protein